MEIKRCTHLTEGQITQLGALLVAVVEEGASVGYLPPLSQQEAEAYWHSVLQPGVLLWVAEESGLIQGTVQLELAQKSNGRHRAEVCKLLVHPRAQRRGIGRTLMEALETEALKQGRTLLILDTREGDPSNRLYRSMGFVESGRIPQFAKSANGQLDTSVFYYKLLER